MLCHRDVGTAEFRPVGSGLAMGRAQGRKLWYSSLGRKPAVPWYFTLLHFTISHPPHVLFFHDVKIA